MIERRIVLENETGLHARPATELVKKAGQYNSKVSVIKGEVEYNAKSILSLMSAGAKKGDEIIIRAVGEDEAEAIEGIVELIKNNFNE
jgi:phosphocarrier protein